jgi:hypothetical protein
LTDPRLTIPAPLTGPGGVKRGMDSLPSTISLEESRAGLPRCSGREPESEQVLAMWASLGDAAAIAEQFLATDELSSSPAGLSARAPGSPGRCREARRRPMLRFGHDAR